MHGSRRGLRLAICAGFYFTVLTALQWKLNGGLTKQTLISRRWFSKAVKITNVLEHVQQQSALSICETIKNVIVVQDDTKATLHNLINYGDQWVKLDDQTVRREPMYFLQSELDRVAGCTSTVHIRTSYESTSNSLFNGSLVSRKKNDRTIRVEGTADSRVTQGMLAILCRVFNSLRMDEALSLSAAEVTQYFGLDALLPSGRQNTFYNMIVLIQAQLRRLAEGGEASNSSSTVSMSEQHNDSCESLLKNGNVEQGRLSMKILQDSCGINARNTLTTSQGNVACVVGNTFSDISSISAVPSGAAAVTTAAEGQAIDPRREEVALLISGGVDSSVALRLLLEQGYKVRAYYLKIWLEDELAHLNSCPWEEDLQYAQAVCDQLGVPLETVSLQKEYWRDVVQYTLQEAKRGHTPNPDIMCNSRVKFGRFYDYVGRFHSKIASGHYAQVKSIRQLHSRFPLESNSNAGSHLFADAMQDTTAEIRLREANYNPEDVLLLRSPDPVKDQSYFLCNLSQAQLRRCLFPIGHLQKSEVRRLAETFDLPTKHRRDSQGICFLGKLKFDDFIEHYLGQHPGVIRSVDTGQELGQHRGLWFHTLGQRKGLGTLMKSGTVNYGPWYVCAKDMRSNTLFVSNVTHARSDNPTYVVEEVNWINGMPRELFGEEASACAPGTPQAQVAEKVTGTGSGLHVYMKLRHSPTLVEGYIHRASSTPLDNHSAIDTAGSGTIDSQSTTISLNSHIRKRTNFSCCGSTRNSVVVRLQDSSESVAPGQFVAFYQGEVCIGSGVVADLPAPAAES